MTDLEVSRQWRKGKHFDGSELWQNYHLTPTGRVVPGCNYSITLTSGVYKLELHSPSYVRLGDYPCLNSAKLGAEQNHKLWGFKYSSI